MITLLRWRRSKNNVKSKGADVKTDAVPPSNVPALPLEIVDKILREACELPPRGAADRRLLSACAVVCKSWKPFAQSLLYHSLTVENSLAHVSRNPGTLGPGALIHRSHLLTFTKSLTIRVVDEFAKTLPVFAEEGIPGGRPESVRIADFVTLLAHSPGLRHLRLSVAWSRKERCSFEPWILDWLSSLSLPMEVLDLKYDRHADSPLAYDLVRLWPKIRALRVRTDYDLPLPERPSTRLRELRLPVTSLPAVIEWFLPPVSPHDRSQLRVLELYEIPAGARAPLSAHGPNVSSLTLTRQPASGLGLADLFTNLEEFVIAGPFWSSPLPTLPKTLMHIRLQVHAFISDSVLPAIAAAVPSLGNLRALTLEEAVTKDKYYPTLREACATNRVEILVNSVNPSLSGTVHPYLAEMDRFPRRHTFAEFFDAKRWA